MAINSKNFVDITTTFPTAGATPRALGGMVFTQSIPLEQDKDSLYFDEVSDYNGGKDITLSLDGVKEVFGETSKEYEFASGYYSYISPSGRTPSALKFKKIDTGLSLLENFEELDKSTNQFGSFTFLPPADSSTESNASVTSSFIEELRYVAEANDKLDTKYLFVVNQPARDGVSYTTAMANSEMFSEFAGVCFVYGATDVSAYMPMAILASTNYTSGQVVNFMFKQFSNEVPTVHDQKTYSDFNQHLVNFYGRTQSNGETLDFFQRGINTDGNDTAIYCNEMWFKAACETALLDMLVAAERIPADANGVASVKTTVAEVCSVASSNGTFMQKTVDSRGRKTVREIVTQSGGEEQDVDGIITDVEAKGYSIYAYLSEKADKDKLGKTSEKIIVYYVFYGTADSIRFIKGYDILLK